MSKPYTSVIGRSIGALALASLCLAASVSEVSADTIVYRDSNGAIATMEGRVVGTSNQGTVVLGADGEKRTLKPGDIVTVQKQGDRDRVVRENKEAAEKLEREKRALENGTLVKGEDTGESSEAGSSSTAKIVETHTNEGVGGSTKDGHLPEKTKVIKVNEPTSEVKSDVPAAWFRKKDEASSTSARTAEREGLTKDNVYVDPSIREDERAAEEAEDLEIASLPSNSENSIVESPSHAAALAGNLDGDLISSSEDEGKATPNDQDASHSGTDEVKTTEEPAKPAIVNYESAPIAVPDDKIRVESSLDSDGKGESGYINIRVGQKWVRRINGQRETTDVVGFSRFEDQDVYTLETRKDKDPNAAPVVSHIIATRKGGKTIFFMRTIGDNFTLMLVEPLSVGMEWRYRGRTNRVSATNVKAVDDAGTEWNDCVQIETLDTAGNVVLGGTHYFSKTAGWLHKLIEFHDVEDEGVKKVPGVNTEGDSEEKREE